MGEKKVMSEEQPKRWKRGDIGPDGRVFLKYSKKFKSGEYWTTPEKLEKTRVQERTGAKARYNKNGRVFSIAQKEAQRIRDQRSGYVERKREYKKTSKYKDYLKEYNQRECVKIRKYEHNKKPESKRKKNEYLSDYRKRDYVKNKLQKSANIRHNNKQKTIAARDYMAALLAAQELSQALKNKPTTENEISK